MKEISDASSLAVIWLLFSGVIAVICIFVLRWAVKNRQFSDPEHSAGLPLESIIPAKEELPDRKGGG